MNVKQKDLEEDGGACLCLLFISIGKTKDDQTNIDIFFFIILPSVDCTIVDVNDGIV